MSTYTDSAVAGTGRDAGVPWHYGDPLREQKALATRAGVVDRSNRDVLVVPGDDRLGWLHSICSQHVAALADGDSTEALVLSPNGHVELHWQFTELGGQVWLDTEPGAGEASLDYLRKMQFLKRVDPAEVSAQWAVLSVLGPDAPGVLAAARLPVPDAAGRAVAVDGGGFVRRTDRPDGTVFDLVVPRERRAGVLAAVVDAGAEPAGVWAYEALRVAARVPRAGNETDHRTIPHEVEWIGRAVHLQKGCYRGQETVARVQNLGRPPRRLTLVHFAGDSDDLPPSGSPVEIDGRTVGFLGTAVQHWEEGPIGLVVVKRNVPDGFLTRIAGQTAQEHVSSAGN